MKNRMYGDTQLSYQHTYDAHPDPKRFYMHTHTGLELYLFISGKGVYHIEGSEYPLHSGDLLLMCPAEAHYIEIDRRFPYERMVVHFQADVLKKCGAEALLSPFFDREPGKNNLFTAADMENSGYRLFLKEMEADASDPHLQLLSYLLPLLYSIRQAAARRTSDAQPETTVYTILRYLNEHLAEELSLAHICNAFFISKAQLCRSFKHATGSTVWEYITAKRLLRARQLIESGTPAATAAAQCGFGEYSAFYRAYRKRFGVSPRTDRVSVNAVDAGNIE